MLKKWQLVLVILVVASVPVPVMRDHALLTSDVTNVAIIQNQQSLSYTSHTPIIINSNLDFELQGWLGNGTQSNPYVIEGLSIITDGKECINISNTDAFFVVRDCYISSVSDWDRLYNRGVTLGNVAHGMIEDLIISKKWLAITIGSSSNCSVVECEIYDNCLAVDIHGPYGEEYPEHCTVFNNTIYENHEGVHLSFVRKCLIDSNNITGDVSLQGTVECTVSNNRIDGSQTGHYPFYLSPYEAVDTFLANNTMINSGLNLDYTSIPGLQLYNNTVNDKPVGYFVNLSDTSICPNDYGQIILVECANVTVQDGEICNTADGVDFFSCSDCTLKNCTIYSCGYGITLCQSDACSVILNDFHYNRQWGIAIAESDNSIVAANTVYQNQGIGIFVSLFGGFGNAFFHNVICANGEGYTISDGNSWDGGPKSVWDDGLSLGNYWDDYGGTGEYHIPGDAGSVDRYPARMMSVGESGLWIGFSITPSGPLQNESITVSAGVIDVDGVDEVILSYSIDGNVTWTNFTMAQYGPVWTTTIPPHGEYTTVTYKVFVLDRVGNIESSDVYSYGGQGSGITSGTTGTQEDWYLSISMAIAIGGTVAIMALAVLLSRKRY